ncbi:MAG: hypothetical protein M1814_003330 [Vezdaea aestivalis]|nr:MAG: hypothetical protein M1814_003330 [Vezdaea aestivalis]
MAPAMEISIPTTSLSAGAKTYTQYDVALRLPLRSYTVQKRFSEFIDLHTALANETGTAPPFALPQKSWFTRTVTSPALTAQRRQGLEQYMQSINEAENTTWRTASAWRAFLNLPTSLDSAYSSSAAQLHGKLVSPAGGGAPISDSRIWLDCHKELKIYLHDARLFLAKRDQASTSQSQHENSAAAKRNLVRAGSMISALEEGLNTFSKASSEAQGSSALGDGELRRRRDLVDNAKQEKDGLESLLISMATSSGKDTNAAASEGEKTALIGGGTRRGRVLGGPVPETDRTRELDNTGVLQLQRQMMDEQNSSLERLQKIVARQREIGTSINTELEEQVAMLKLVDEDVDRQVSHSRLFWQAADLSQSGWQSQSGQEKDWENLMILTLKSKRALKAH